MTALLKGIRVLDFGRYIAGPYCAALLAEYGAEVICIEKREGSEDRFVVPVGEHGVLRGENAEGCERPGSSEQAVLESQPVG